MPPTSQSVMTSNVLRSEYQKSVANYWNTNQNDPVNLLLGQIDGYYHHHYGMGGGFEWHDSNPRYKAANVEIGR